MCMMVVSFISGVNLSTRSTPPTFCHLSSITSDCTQYRTSKDMHSPHNHVIYISANAYNSIVNEYGKGRVEDNTYFQV